MNLKALLAGALFATAFTSAGALSVVPGNNPQIDSNLVRNPCGLSPASASGNPVLGCLNDNHAITVSLSSDESLEITGGQASLDSTDGTFSRLTISLAPLSTVILNIDATQDGFVVFSDGSGPFGQLALSGNGQNFFTATGITGDFLSFITYDPAGAETDIVADVKQIRLGPVTAVPEPETFALMLAGLAAIGFIARRRKTRR